MPPHKLKFTHLEYGALELQDDQVNDEIDVDDNVLPSQPVGETYEENLQGETEVLC